MFGISRFYAFIGGGALILALLIGIRIHLGNDRKVRDRVDFLEGWQGQVVLAVANASGNDKVTWQTAPEQITQMGVDHRSLLDQVEEANAKWLAASQDAEKRKAIAAEQKRLVAKAIAQRDAAMKRLRQETLTPATRDDCDTLIREAGQVQILLRETAKEAGI